jgi:hypothetical protein
MSETNLVPVVVNNQPPVLADGQFSGVVDTLMDNAFSGFGAGLRILKPGKMSFKLIENRQEVDIPNGQVFGVLLGVAPCNYASWYARQYAPGQEPSRPDLVWMMPTADTFPDALPPEYHQKVSVNGQERWGFRIARRTVWALMTNQNGQFYLDLERPVVLDITSTSLYGNSDPRSNSYRWGGIKGFCDRHSQPGVFRCNPAMFVTQIILDPQSPVSGVMLFRPNLDQNGNPAYLDSQTYTSVIQTASTERITEMLRVNEILTYTPNGVGATQPVPAAVNIGNSAQVMQPMAQPVQQPVAQPVQQPVVQPVQQPVAQPVQQPVVQPVQQPVAQPAPQPVQQPVAQPAPQPVQQPMAQPAPQPVQQPMAQPAPQPVQQPMAQPAPQPVQQPMAQPAPSGMNDMLSRAAAVLDGAPAAQPAPAPAAQPAPIQANVSKEASDALTGILADVAGY